MPNGEFIEVHEELTPEKKWLLTSHEQNGPLELPEIDKAGVRRTDAIRNRLRSRMSAANAEVAPKVTSKDLNEIEHH